MWNEKEIYGQIDVIDGKVAPTIVIQNATFLHSIFKQWITGNIWISGDRIVYTGPKMPPLIEGSELVDATGKFIVPGYIEPHVHPFQLYNPETFAEYAGKLGTTTFLADNMTFFMMLGNEKAFTLIEQLNQLPFSFYWWARFDSQTVLKNEKELYNASAIQEWINREDVLMGGELTGWTRLLAGDVDMLSGILAAKRAGKRIEGHFPGASERTLARMRLFGADGDHEAMTFEEVERRLHQGYAVTLRHSSIRPDLPIMLKDITKSGLNVFDHLMMTTDGSTPSFHQDGVMDKCISAALEAGVSPIDAYLMASYNPARYYGIDGLHGVIAPGRYATLNILGSETDPVPTGVLSKGEWLLRGGEQEVSFKSVDWSIIPRLDLPFELTDADFRFDSPLGIEMVNDVITKPYESSLDLAADSLPADQDESFLMLIDRTGKWRVNSLIKGFDLNVAGIASSYSNTGDILLIGKDKRSMRATFEEMKQMGGGMVLMEHGEAVAKLHLPIGGGLSDEPVERLIDNELMLKQALAERGYHFGDAVYTFLFLQSTHLPYVRITQLGLYNVMKNKVILPAAGR